MPKQPIKEKKSTSRAATAKRPLLHHLHEANGFGPQLSARRAKPKASPFSNLDPAVALGIIAMGIAGAATATFMVIKSNKRTTHFPGNIYQKYQNLKDEAEEYAHDAYERGKQAYDSATDYADGIREAAHDAIEQPYSGSLLLAGAIGGTLLGASAVYALNRYQEGASRPQDFLSKIVDVFGNVKHAAESFTGQTKAGSWFESAKQFVEALQEHTGAHEEEEEEAGAHHRHTAPGALRDAIHLGVIGLRLWENLQHKKR